MKATLTLLVLALAVGCSDKGGSDTSSGDEGGNGGNGGNGGGGDGGDDHGDASLTILSPTDGDVFEYGDEVTLTVEASYEDGTDATVSQVSWSAGSWSGNGSTLTVADLPVGALTVAVEGKVDGETLSDSVGITVNAPAPVNFAGSLDATVELPDYHIDTDCTGSVSFQITYDGLISGSGSCTAFDNNVSFSIDGTDSGGAIAGNMTMSDGTTDYATPYTGTRSESDHVSASFDKTFSTSDGKLRLYGTFTADPR